MISLLKTASKHLAEMLRDILKCKKAVLSLLEKMHVREASLRPKVQRHWL